MLPYGWNYKSFAQDAYARLQAGAIGRVEYALCHMASPWKSFLDPKMRVMSQWKPSLAAPDPATWQVKANGGGYAHGQITHSAGLLFWLTGLRATEVSCRMSAPSRPVDEYDAAHVAFNNGAIGCISGAANLIDDDKFQLDLRIFGSEGVLMLDVERERMEIRRHDGRHYSASIRDGEGAYSCEVPPHRFIEVLKGEARNDSSGEVGAATVELIAAMFESAGRNGIPATVKDYAGGKA
jgi:predicted dehydrogenase